MPSQRKRIGFLPSKEVHDIIDKICRANEFSQSKVTGLLVEEALRSRGVLGDSLSGKSNNNNDFFNDSFEPKPFIKISIRDPINYSSKCSGLNPRGEMNLSPH